MFIKNEIDHIVQISKRLRLNMLYEINYENVFFVKILLILSNSSNKNLSKFFINIIN